MAAMEGIHRRGLRMNRQTVGLILAFVLGGVAGGGVAAFKTSLQTRARAAVADTALLQLLADTNSPVVFDPAVGQYRLTYRVVADGGIRRVSYILRYSPFTGQPLAARPSGGS
jgi:hypothetical protein